MTKIFQLNILLVGCLYGAFAFVVPQRQLRVVLAVTTSSTTTTLNGKVKRGKLGREVDEAAVPVRKQTKKANKQSGAAASGTNISPALAEWMASQQESDDDTSSSASLGTSTEQEEKDETSSSSKKGRKNRLKQSARKAAEDARDERVEGFVKELGDLIESKGSVDDLLGLIRQLLELPTANFKQLSASAARQDFRLAWVGSDDAVCHVGTGLHKVALARLQEVFLSFCGRNRIEIQEVIRILGPFPNVKNILQGQSAFSRRQDDDVVEWRLTWDSMVDGTGKEILAGKEENVQRVNLQVYFSSPSIVVAVVPPNDEDMTVRRADPLEDNGQHVLVFVREDNLLDQLETLRVA